MSSVLTLAILFILVTLSTPIEYENEHGDADRDGDYIDLDEMSDEELEDICKSRGFELVRELNATTGEPILYTHQDYVDAASECLQIEADLEEILTKHPEILEDVRRESERMMHQRDRLQDKLNQIEMGMGKVEKEPVPADTWVEQGQETDAVAEEILELIQNERGGSTVFNATTRLEEIVSNTTPALKPKSLFDPKEIAREVIQHIKSDATKVLNIIAPKHLRVQVRPALRTFLTVAKDMGLSIYDLMRRHLTVFWGENNDIRNSTTGTDANAGSPPSQGGG